MDSCPLRYGFCLGISVTLNPTCIHANHTSVNNNWDSCHILHRHDQHLFDSHKTTNNRICLRMQKANRQNHHKKCLIILICSEDGSLSSTISATPWIYKQDQTWFSMFCMMIFVCKILLILVRFKIWLLSCMELIIICICCCFVCWIK